MIRDYALSVSGTLSPKLGGPGARPYQPANIWEVVGLHGSRYTQDKGEGLYRRTLYNFWKRQAPSPNMEAFNAPTREVCTVRRERTNTPLQALVTLNDPQFVEAARRLAEPQRGGGIHGRGICLAANAISAEKPAGRGCFAHAWLIAPCRLRMKPGRARQAQARRGVRIKPAGYSRTAAAGPSACRSGSGDRRWVGNTCPSAHRALVRRRCAAFPGPLPLPPQRQGR